jgi:NSS family neurotransmitter:Na+ symporter
MIELATRILMDGGMARTKAVRVVTGAVIVLGMPSAVSLTVFQNQDWVWGVGLMISGLFISLLVTIYGSRRFRDEFVNITPGGVNVGAAFEVTLKYVIPALFVVMFGWWMYTAATVYDPAGWWNPDPINHTFSVGTCVVQWGAAMLLLMAFNRKLAESSTRAAVATEVEE